ncbi:hypothetical protein PoB_004717000 [Plakobranchus ocellatus]|uniref:Uncharacterized protein n=1 Tax=Plakobranchus ocellatus TaxID=259542 RepID=A0AAV4BJG4_9GAST|nr:hypothetical protein PoB_004717000 [Plakobranchus ocellatus]
MYRYTKHTSSSVTKLSNKKEDEEGEEVKVGSSSDLEPIFLVKLSNKKDDEKGKQENVESSNDLEAIFLLRGSPPPPSQIIVCTCWGGRSELY